MQKLTGRGSSARPGCSNQPVEAMPCKSDVAVKPHVTSLEPVGCRGHAFLETGQVVCGRAATPGAAGQFVKPAGRRILSTPHMQDAIERHETGS